MAQRAASHPTKNLPESDTGARVPPAVTTHRSQGLESPAQVEALPEPGGGRGRLVRSLVDRRAAAERDEEAESAGR